MPWVLGLSQPSSCPKCWMFATFWDCVMDENVFSPWTVTGTALLCSAKRSRHSDLPGKIRALCFPLARRPEKAPEKLPPSLPRPHDTKLGLELGRGGSETGRSVLSQGRMLQVGLVDAGSPATTGDVSMCLLQHYLGDLGITQSPQVWELTAPRHSAGSQHTCWKSSFPLTLGKMK